jgi:hypothetical protein
MLVVIVMLGVADGEHERVNLDYDIIDFENQGLVLVRRNEVNVGLYHSFQHHLETKLGNEHLQ